MEEWINEIRNLDFREYQNVLKGRIEEAKNDYYRILIYAFALNTIVRMPWSFYGAMRKKYRNRVPVILDDDEDPIMDLLVEQMLNHIHLERNGIKGKVTIKFKEGVWYKIVIDIDIPEKIVHDKYAEFSRELRMRR